MQVPEADCAALPAAALTVANVTHRGERVFSMAVHDGQLVDGVSRQIVSRGHWDLSHPQQLADLAGVGATLPMTGRHGGPPTLLDVGSNVGFYSLLFAHHGISGARTVD